MINLRHQIIMFIVMIIIGITFNPMNMLAYKFVHLDISLTLFYGGLLMASNMIWSHEIVHYLSMNMFNTKLFFIGLFLSTISIVLLRKQLFVDDKQWMKRMIPHHSTALTTSYNIYNKTKDERIKQLSKNIIDTQEKEIKLMKSYLKE